MTTTPITFGLHGQTPPNRWGSCFDAAAHNLLCNPGFTMCHGIGIANRPGEEGAKIAHAWLEFDHPFEGRGALDCIWLVAQSAALYRKNMQAECVVEYSLNEFLRLWKKHDFPGPWDPEIKKFTSDYKA